MKRAVWNKFVQIRDDYRNVVVDLERRLPGLRKLQQKLVNGRAGEQGAYPVETPVLYNFALDDITAGDDIRLILVADNPGRREQAAENRRYLVGPSGKIAGRFFREHPELGIDFENNVIILNKTPVHTPRTVLLRDLCLLDKKNGAIEAALEESQQEMARLLFEFHRALAPVPVWIIGYSEMKKGGIFEAYTKSIIDHYAGSPLRGQVLLFRHFSMNQFTIDLKNKLLNNNLNNNAPAGEPLADTLDRIGAAYRLRILGW